MFCVLFIVVYEVTRKEFQTFFLRQKVGAIPPLPPADEGPAIYYQVDIYTVCISVPSL